MTDRGARYCGVRAVSRAITESPWSVSGAAVTESAGAGAAAAAGGGGGSRSPHDATPSVPARSQTAGLWRMHGISGTAARGASRP